MSGWVVQTHPSMIKLIFWKLLENRVFPWECCSVIFVKDAYCLLIPYLPESLLRVYIWVREYGPVVLAGPIVMIAAHRVVKQSWRFWCEVAAVRKSFRRWMSPQFMTLNIWMRQATWEDLGMSYRVYLALKMSDSSGDLVVSIVGVCFLIVGGNGSGESRVSDEPSCPGNLNCRLRMFSG